MENMEHPSVEQLFENIKKKYSKTICRAQKRKLRFVFKTLRDAEVCVNDLLVNVPWIGFYESNGILVLDNIN